MARQGKATGGRGGGSGGASAGAIRAGGAFVELFTKDGALRKGLNSASKMVSDWAARVAKLAAAGLATAGVAFGAAVGHFINRGDSIKKASDRLGISAETLSAMGYAASQSGSDLAGLEKGIRFLQKTVEEAADGSAEAAESFQALGLSAEELRQMKPDEMWLAVADSLSKVQNVTERNALAMKAFGKSGVDLIPLLLGGSRGVRSLMEEAARTGQVVTAEQAASAERLGDALERVWAAIKGAIFSVGAALVPLTADIEKVSFFVVDVIKRFSEWIQSANVLGTTFSWMREEWDKFFAAYESADIAGRFELQTSAMRLAWENLASYLQKRMQEAWTFVARIINAGVFTIQDVLARFTGGDREQLARDAIQSDLELTNMGKERIAEIERRRQEAKNDFDKIVKKEAIAAVAPIVKIEPGKSPGAIGMGGSARGGFNIGNATQQFGGSSVFEELKRQGNEQNGLLRDVLMALRNVPLAKL